MPEQIASGKTGWSSQHNNARILLALSSSLPITGAGYAVRSHAIASHLLRHGVDIDVYTKPGYPLNTWTPPKEVAPHDDVEGVRYNRIPLYPVGMGEYGPEYRARAASLLAAIARRGGHSIIHAASDMENGLPAMLAAEKAGIPGIYEYRGMWHYSSAASNTWFPWTEPYKRRQNLELECGHRAKAVFAISETLKKDLAANGLPEEKITVLPNAVDAARFTPLAKDAELTARYSLAGRIVIGFIGSFTYYEGLENLMESVLALNWQGLPVSLLMVGDGGGGYLRRLKNLRRAYGDHPAIIFTGRVPFADVPKYYSVMDIMPFCRIPAKVCQCVPPLKPLEAMAMQKAVMASDVAALTEIVRDGETGLVFRAGDQADLTAKLGELVRNNDLRQRLAAGGRQWVIAERDWRDVSRKILHVYEKLLEKS